MALPTLATHVSRPFAQEKGNTSTKTPVEAFANQKHTFNYKRVLAKVKRTTRGATRGPKPLVRAAVALAHGCLLPGGAKGLGIVLGRRVAQTSCVKQGDAMHTERVSSGSGFSWFQAVCWCNKSFRRANLLRQRAPVLRSRLCCVQALRGGPWTGVSMAELLRLPGVLMGLLLPREGFQPGPSRTREGLAQKTGDFL